MDWLGEAFVGSLIGLALPYVGRGVMLTVAQFSADDLTGEWWAYNVSFDGATSVFTERWAIRRGLRGSLRIRAASHPDGLRRFKGTGIRERDHLVVSLRATSHTETVSLGFQLPSTQSSQMIGLWLARDFSGAVAAAPQLLSRAELSVAEARRIVRARYRLDPRSKMVQVPRWGLPIDTSS